MSFEIILLHCLHKHAKLLAQCHVWEKEAKALEASNETPGKHPGPLSDMDFFRQVLRASLCAHLACSPHHIRANIPMKGIPTWFFRVMHAGIFLGC